MKFTRAFAAVAATGLVAGGLALATVDTASAHKSHFRVEGPAPIQVTNKKILGRAMQKVGTKKKGLLNVHVAAYRQLSGGVLADEPTASDDSYDYVGPRQKSYPGAFGLKNLTKGNYTVVMSKKGFLTQTFEDISITRTFPRYYLGDVLMKPIPTTTTKVKWDADSVKCPKGKCSPAGFTVSVKPDTGKAPATGKVTIYWSTKADPKKWNELSTKTLSRTGTADAKLGPEGKISSTMKLWVYAAYKGSPTAKSSESDATSMKFVRP